MAESKEELKSLLMKVKEKSVFYFAVPVFFIITGITLMDYQERYSTKEYFKKRAVKVLIPYIFWSLMGAVYLVATHKVPLSIVTPKYIINGLLSASEFVAYFWYFQPLFCVYLCIPLFAAIDKEKKNKAARYILFVCFIVNILIPFLNLGLSLGIEWPYTVAVGSGYLFLTWAGYYIYHNPPTIKQKIIIYILAAIGLFVHIFGTYTMSLSYGGIIEFYKGYCNVPCIFYSFGIFVLLRDIAIRIEKSAGLKKLFVVMAKYSFSVYLLQWFVLSIIDDLKVFDIYSLLYRLLMPLPVYAVIMLIVFILRKIPVIRKLVP